MDPFLPQDRHVYRLGIDFIKDKQSALQLLGGKGASLTDMVQIGLAVPPAFTISTRICDIYHNSGGHLPDFIWAQVQESMVNLESQLSLKFAASQRPLLVSVRSGASVSMPGMMDTILNLGVCERTLNGLIQLFGNERFVYDSYRRLISMYANVVLGIPSKRFSLNHVSELSISELKNVCHEFLSICQTEGKSFPQDPWDQLKRAIGAVFESWYSPRAVAYRRIHRISEKLGTAVTVQAMVFGNMGERSATGVCFTRHPATGEKIVFGEYLPNAQGEDVVAGIRTPLPMPSLEKSLPSTYKQLTESLHTLENHYKDMQDVEFTIQENKLFFLQTRVGKRTAKAAVKIAVDMVKEGLIDESEALMRVDPYVLQQLLHPQIHPDAKKKVLCQGLPASPGVAIGKIVFDAHTALQRAGYEKVVLVRSETSPEDIEGMNVAQGILTACGGMTSHAAVVARGMGKCCVCGCGGLEIHEKDKTCLMGGKLFKEGDLISLDGSTGEVLEGEVSTVPPDLDENYAVLMQWADKFRTMKVRANADTPADAHRARSLGAEGIGLTRTEHMFFDSERISMVRQMILAPDLATRKQILGHLKNLQKNDFIGIFYEMSGYPVTIRLLDPPLHEFLPREDKEIRNLAHMMGKDEEWIRNRTEALDEVNPMLGHRGARVGVCYPEVYEMQVEAIVEAALELNAQKKVAEPKVEIMVPLTFDNHEFQFIRERIEAACERVFDKAKTKVDVKIGTMIEIPRAALVADKIARVADFFSFGTNDLTQMTLGISRDDSSKFIPTYVEKKILSEDPFVSIEEEGVGQLMMLALSKAKMVRERKLHYGICGEHGGDPRSIYFCQKLGLDYVSCSPLRVPVARLAVAQAFISCERNIVSL